MNYRIFRGSISSPKTYLIKNISRRVRNFFETDLTITKTDIWPHVRYGHKKGKENKSDTSKAYRLEVYPA